MSSVSLVRVRGIGVLRASLHRSESTRKSVLVIFGGPKEENEAEEALDEESEESEVEESEESEDLSSSPADRCGSSAEAAWDEAALAEEGGVGEDVRRWKRWRADMVARCARLSMRLMRSRTSIFPTEVRMLSIVVAASELTDVPEVQGTLWLRLDLLVEGVFF